MSPAAALVGAVLAAAGGVAAAVEHPWKGGAGDGAATVVRARLVPGRFLLTLRNRSSNTVRVAQVIVNDAFQSFRGTRPVQPGATATVAVPYPWIEGESYEVDLMTSTGATIEFEVDDAAAGTTS